MRRTFGLALVCALASALACRAEEARVTRADVALGLRRFERALASASPAGDELARVNQAFDRATIAFFAGDRRGTLRQLDALTLGLLGRGDDPAARAAMGLRVRVTPARAAADAPRRLVLTRLYDVEPGPGLTVGVARGAGAPLLEVDAGVGGEAPWPAGEAGPADDVVWLVLGELRLEAARVSVTPEDPAGLRSRLAERLARLAPAPAGPAACFEARLRLLAAEPDEEDTAQMFLDAAAHAAELQRELEALEAGADPYRGRPGEQWRALRVGGRDVPYRVQAPAAPKDGARLPLLVAFHGFQGDENMFRWAYGAGRLFELAAAEGWLLCTPRTEPFLRDGALFDRLLEELSDDYPVDPRRVFLLGHSMGSQAVLALRQRRPEAVAGVVVFSGGAPGGEAGRALAILGRNDPLGGFGRRAAEGPGVRVLDGWGHTLVVGPHLPDALAFLRGLAPRRVYY